MPYRHVEDTEPQKGNFEVSRSYGWSGPSKSVSTETKAHSIYRCTHCRALAVTIKGDPPPSGPCGKCKAP